MKNSSTVVVEASIGGQRSVTVGGHLIRGVRAVSTRLEVDAAPVVTLDLVLGHAVKFEGASILVGDVVMPPAVERALWKHLAAKYVREIDVTTLDSTSREWALRDG